MFGISKEKLEKELQGLHRRIGRRLFGESGQDCLNLYPGEGVIGQLFRRVDSLEEYSEKLAKEIEALRPKKRTPKATPTKAKSKK